MTRFLLDTNIVSFVMKQPGGAVDFRFQHTPRTAVAISSVVEGELRFGVERLPPEARSRRILADLLKHLAVLPWTSSCAQEYGTLRATLERQGTPMGIADTMIAAHALALGLTLVTNDQDFAIVRGLKLQNWTKGPERT